MTNPTLTPGVDRNSAVQESEEISSTAQRAINDIVSSTQAAGIATPGTMSMQIAENYDSP